MTNEVGDGHAGGTAHAEAVAEHHVSMRRYLIVWVALVVLTGAMLGLSYLPMGRYYLVFALGIAFVKASLVVLFFMHMHEQRGAMRLALIVSVAFVVILGAGASVDEVTRFPLAVPSVPPRGGPVRLYPEHAGRRAGAPGPTGSTRSPELPVPWVDPLVRAPQVEAPPQRPR